MADRPIIFSAPMVRALLDGRKTQTRRPLNPQPKWDVEVRHTRNDSGPFFWPIGSLGQQCGMPIPKERVRYAPGDRLYVRETWRASYGDDWYRDDLGRCPKPSDLDPATTAIEYLADGERELGGKTRVAIHMPRWASRLTLIVEDVRVERLQAISEEDAIAEGILWQEPTDEDRQWAREFAEENGGDADIRGVFIAPGTDCGFGPKPRQPHWGTTAAFTYGSLWDSLHGDGAWDENPWVVALTFRVIHGNIDQVPA